MDDLQKATTGDQEALSRLLQQEYETLNRFAARRIPPDLQSKISAEDILQDAFVQVFRDIQQFQQRDGSTFAAWLQQIVANRLFDAIRKLRRKKRGGQFFQRENNDAFRDSVRALVEEVEGGADSPSRVVAREEAIDEMQVAIGALPEEQRDAILCRYIDRLSLEQTAKKLGKSEAAVRGLLHRGKAALRGHMQESGRWLSKKL